MYWISHVSELQDIKITKILEFAMYQNLKIGIIRIFQCIEISEVTAVL